MNKMIRTLCVLVFGFAFASVVTVMAAPTATNITQYSTPVSEELPADKWRIQGNKMVGRLTSNDIPAIVAGINALVTDVATTITSNDNTNVSVSNLVVRGTTEITKTLHGAGAANFDDALSVQGALLSSNTFRSIGAMTADSTLKVQGTLTASNGFTVTAGAVNFPIAVTNGVQPTFALHGVGTNYVLYFNGFGSVTQVTATAL